MVFSSNKDAWKQMRMMRDSRVKYLCDYAVKYLYESCVIHLWNTYVIIVCQILMRIMRDSPVKYLCDSPVKYLCVIHLSNTYVIHLSNTYAWIMRKIGVRFSDWFLENPTHFWGIGLSRECSVIEVWKKESWVTDYIQLLTELNSKPVRV